jgi:hypothetical protein
MTDRRPPACHFDRDLAERVTREHRDDCATPETHDGCAPCTAPHCVLCGRRHLDNDHPTTDDECIGNVRTDITEILWLCRHLRWQAARAGHNGRLAAAAPIPGADAMVLIARAGADGDDLIWSPTLDDDHAVTRLVPPLLPLAGWDHQWRAYFDHDDPASPSVAGIIHYLTDHLTQMSRATDGPDWPGFARDMAALRRQLEQVLHDEHDPERGIPCFECGDHLVRKFGDPRPCRHRTPARTRLAAEEQRAAAGRGWLQLLATYPELAGPTHAERAAARPPTSAAYSAAAAPCEKCIESKAGQGGIENPAVGQSWECLGCRKHYTPGEYANAVRAHLLKSGPDGDGWTHIPMAAEAATTQTGLAIPPATVRKWMDRGKVSALCRWTPGVSWGQRLVFWPDVADEAAAAVVRAHEAELARQRRAKQEQQLRKRVDAGMDPEEAGRLLGIHPRRVEAIVLEWEADARRDDGRTGGKVSA